MSASNLQNFDPKGIVGKATSFNEYVGTVLVPAHFSAPKIGVPVLAKTLATKYLDASRPRAVVQEIYEAGLAIEVGIVITLRDKGKMNEYTQLMYEEDMFHQTKALARDGDGGIALT